MRIGGRWLLALGLAACHRKEPAPPAGVYSELPARGWITGVALVDSVPVEDGPSFGVLRRVEVLLGARHDTVPGVLTFDLPGVLADTAVVGFAYDQDSVTGVFVYAPERRQVTRRAVAPPLADFDPTYAAPTFAPDGRSFLYIAGDSDQDSVRPTLRTWPALEKLAQGPAVEFQETDVPPWYTTWRGRDTAIATFSFGSCPAPLSLETAFVLSAETMRSDTVVQLDEPPGTRHWWPWRDSVNVPPPADGGWSGVAWLVASTDGPGLGPGFVLRIRAGRTLLYADTVSDVDFQLEGRTCPGVPVGGPADARDAFLHSVRDSAWSPAFLVAAPNRREDYGTPPRLVSYQWSELDRVVQKVIAWNGRTHRFDVVAPASEAPDSAATP